MIPNTKCRHGFTLIELLVVVAIFMILALLVTNSLFSILKSNTKANIMKEIRQNGTYALDIMGKTISSGRKIEECLPSSLKVTDVGNQQIAFGCLSQPIGGLTQISLASDSARLTSTNITLENCNVFACEEIESGEGFGKVTISFTLKQLGTPARPEETARQTFTKTIFLRNK